MGPRVNYKSFALIQFRSTFAYQQTLSTTLFPKERKKALCTTIVVHESSLVSWPLAIGHGNGKFSNSHT